MVKKIFFFLFILRGFASQPEPFALLTIPKSGSHLLIKSLYYMTGLSPYWHIDPPIIGQLLQKRQFPYTHCCLSPSLLQYYARASIPNSAMDLEFGECHSGPSLDNCSSAVLRQYSPPLDRPNPDHSEPPKFQVYGRAWYIKQILGIRDLRDVCVSIVYQIHKGQWPEFSRNLGKREAFKLLSFDEQLLFVIRQEYELNPPEIVFQHGIGKVARQAMALIQNREILVCPYEELVGPRGGGSEEAQKKLLRKISCYIGLSLSPQQIDEISSHLYGDDSNPFDQGVFSDYQSTFREGKIGSWKSVFKEIHKQAFKERLGQALIALGYERDNDW